MLNGSSTQYQGSPMYDLYIFLLHNYWASPFLHHMHLGIHCDV